MRDFMRGTRGLILFILTIIVVAAAGSSFPLAAQKINAVREGEPEFQLPDEVKPFVEAGMKAIAYAKSDLNGDGALDYIVVLEMIKEPQEEFYPDTSERPTLIIVRDKNEKLSLAARSGKVVFCRICAGGMGDPFDDITIERGGFSITNRGGNRERWIGIYEFKYSRRDNNWQLARVVNMNYDSGNPNPVYKKTYTSPKHFGKINFDDFDPENFKGKGRRAAARQKTREVNIYILKDIEKNGVSEATLVEVKRRVNARTPLAGAVKALLAGATGGEDEKDVGFSFIYNLQLVSARVRNGKAYINLAYDEDDLECCWGTNMISFFYDAIEKTVLQFPEVKEVQVCANGIENFLVRDPEYQRKCPKIEVSARK